MDLCGHLVTEDGRWLATESGDFLVTECFSPSPSPTPSEETIVSAPWSGVLGSGPPTYIRPRKKKVPWPGDEIEEEELEELLFMLGIDL